MWLTDLQSKIFLSVEIGAGLTAFGLLFMVLGVLLFFDGGLLAIGNVLFLSGITLIIGLAKTFTFFMRKHKIRGTVCFLLGIVLVFLKWPVIGICVELFGFIIIFGDFFPIVITFLRQLPILGNILNLPGISTVFFMIF